MPVLRRSRRKVFGALKISAFNKKIKDFELFGELKVLNFFLRERKVENQRIAALSSATLFTCSQGKSALVKCPYCTVRA